MSSIRTSTLNLPLGYSLSIPHLRHSDPADLMVRKSAEIKNDETIKYVSKGQVGRPCRSGCAGPRNRQRPATRVPGSEGLLHLHLQRHPTDPGLPQPDT